MFQVFEISDANRSAAAAGGIMHSIAIHRELLIGYSAHQSSRLTSAWTPGSGCQIIIVRVDRTASTPRGALAKCLLLQATNKRASYPVVSTAAADGVAVGTVVVMVMLMTTSTDAVPVTRILAPTRRANVGKYPTPVSV